MRRRDKPRRPSDPDYSRAAAREGKLACVTGKTGFRTERKAAEALALMTEHPGNRRAKAPRRCYPCRHCPWWHLTSLDDMARPDLSALLLDPAV